MQNVGLKRNTIDKYYTSKKCVENCIKLIKQNLNINKDDLCIEPSAGNGSFINYIKTLSDHHLFYDIKPEHSEIKKLDYTKFYYKIIKNKYKNIHVIGNPPFGRQSSLAIKFIKKSCEYCNSISFILPKSFKKNSLQKHFPLNFHLILEQDIEKNSFKLNDNDYDVPCVFQIWIKKEFNREVPEILTPIKFKFVKKNIDHDISFRRVGGTAGKIDRNTLDKSIQSHYFIKFDIPLTDELYFRISNINYFCKDNTVGPRSISKQELIKQFNNITSIY
tara:strand:+ start:258 stop:1085 length:828 start_codon:yes stop_codon:yes gene_type:complete